MAIRTLRASERAGVGKLAFEFLILTVARSGEVRGAVWTEIDTAGREWDRPGRTDEDEARPPGSPVVGASLRLLAERVSGRRP